MGFGNGPVVVQNTDTNPVPVTLGGTSATSQTSSLSTIAAVDTRMEQGDALNQILIELRVISQLLCAGLNLTDDPASLRNDQGI